MDRKILLDAIVPLQQLKQLRIYGTGQIRDFFFVGGFPGSGHLTLEPSQRLHLTLTAEPIVTDFLSPEDRALDAARCALVARLDRFDAGEVNAAALTDAIERLISARVGRALAIHCDADHDDDC